MQQPNIDLILKEIPLFSALTKKERDLISDKCSILDYKKGQVIYPEGSCADAFYCVVSGRVVIYTRDSGGNETVLEYLHWGKYFGIISLLTGEKHSVTAQAINDSVLLVIKKPEFDLVLKKIPRLAVDLSLTLSRRLKNKDLHQKTVFETKVISVFSSYSQAGKSVYALNLALSLNKETHKSVIILDIAASDKTHSLPARLSIVGEYKVLDLASLAAEGIAKTKDFILKNAFGIDLICLFYAADDEYFLKRLLSLVSILVNDYHYIILDLPSQMDTAIFNALNQSDLIYILSSPGETDLKRTHNLIERLKTEFNFQETKIKVIINEYKSSKLTHEEQVQILDAPIFGTLPKIDLGSSERLILDKPDIEYAKAVRRISRNLGDCFVGLALGVGFAYGFCHIGILKVIEEEKIPIDVISGSSIGALIASLWVTGRSSQEILEIILKEFKEPKYIWGLVDLTFPSLGFIKGNKMQGFFKKYLGNKTFYDVKLPLEIIASDVKKKEPRIFNKGLLVDAIMASCSMPGLFRPFRVKEEILLDGGITTPLPTEALFKRGVKKIIAVNVTPSREDISRQYEKVKPQLSIKLPEIIQKKKWFSLKQYFKDKFRINILDLIFSSVEVMQSEMAQKEAQLADVVLHPDLGGLYWLELHRAEEFARRGEEEARRNLDKIWQLINE